MEQKADNKNTFVKVIVWAIVLFALLATLHFLVNSFDLFEFVRKMHGG